MKLFANLYDRSLQWSRHRHAERYLGVLSFAEASFFPIPTDVMLAPMVMAQRERAWRYAAVATITSVLGGVFGWMIGYFAFESLQGWLESTRYWSSYQQAEGLFTKWGVWIVFIAGFSPIPYKVFTIAAGALSMALFPFVIASLVGRGGRYFLVSALVRWGGPHFERHLHKYIDWIGWGCVAILVAAWLIFKD